MINVEAPGMADQISFAVTDPSYIPRQRYYSPQFYGLEEQRLWPRVWQMACRLEEIPHVGDFTEYRICDESVLIVRVSESEIKAFINACRHRATQLATGAGTFAGGEIVCPFHGWAWGFDGENGYVYAEHAFLPQCMTREMLRLRQCKVELWGGCVFINFDMHARPLLEALHPMPSLLDPLGVGDMKVYWWQGVEMNANWKIAQEAFMEGYHVMQTHPQLTYWMGRDFPADYQVYAHEKNGHSWVRRAPSYRQKVIEAMQAAGEAQGGPTTAELVRTQINQLAASNQMMLDGLRGMVMPKDMEVLDRVRERPVPPGTMFLDVYAEGLYEYAAEKGITMPPWHPPSQELWGGIFQIFPNTVILPQYGNALMYRFRPLGPERCLQEVWSLTLQPADAEIPRAAYRGTFDQLDEEAWPQVFRQDFSNIEAQQRGVHTTGFQHMRLSNMYERGIGNMHEHMDGYLADRPSGSDN